MEGGQPASAKDGDPIVLDNPGRCQALAFSRSTLDLGRKERHPPERLMPRGFLKLCVKALTLGHEGTILPSGCLGVLSGHRDPSEESLRCMISTFINRKTYPMR